MQAGPTCNMSKELIAEITDTIDEVGVRDFVGLQDVQVSMPSIGACIIPIFGRILQLCRSHAEHLPWYGVITF